MQTVEKKYYVCEICGKTGQKEEKIVLCQNTHVDLSAALLEETYARGKKYPRVITFILPDGANVEYVYNFSKDARGKISGYDA